MSAVSDTRSKRVSRPSAKLLDSNNTAIPEIAQHAHSKATMQHGELPIAATSTSSGATVVSGDDVTASAACSQSPVAEGNGDSGGTEPEGTSRSQQQRHKVTVTEVEDEDAPASSTEHDAYSSSDKEPCQLSGESEASEPEGTSSKRKKSQRRRKSKERKRQKKNHGSDVEVEVMDIDTPILSVRRDKSKDVDRFFSPAYTEGGKRLRNCRKCSSGKRAKAITSEVSTLRRHLQACHEGVYLAWCQANEFVSMLPKDTKARKEKAANKASQSRLDGHLREHTRLVPYSDELFNAAAQEWLIRTEQPLQALQHPAFREMIDIAARATNGVKIYNLRNTRQAIIDTFKHNLTNLSKRLNGPFVKGAVNLTCDAWQASTVDGYFAVTGSWIEEKVPGEWKLETALFGFVRLNYAHTGKKLGEALYKVVARLKIEHKIGYITCDNATNNDTMMDHFASHVESNTTRSYSGRGHRVRCLAHIVNLATQALITTYSRSKPYDPQNPDDDLMVNINGRRDVVGLVRSIVVKARSSSKRKQLFLDIQKQAGEAHPRQLLMDMPVRWSSTYVMLHRASELKDHVDQFVTEMARAEKDRGKRQKLDDLQLSPDEWNRVERCLDLLARADQAQQAFSSEEGPSLHLALPALEAIQRSWIARADRPKYAEFTEALEAGCAKVKEYFEKTADSEVYTFALLLDPAQKTNYIRKSWGKDLLAETRAHAEEVYKARYLELYGEEGQARAPARQSSFTGASRTIRPLLRALPDSDSEMDSDDESESEADGSESAKPWLKDFDGYLDSTDDLGGMSIVQWWGRNAHRYPVWASLARDYLSIMASSVSSERAFSSAGITISKRRNRLKADIVEALQCMKSMYHHDILFRDLPSSLTEPDLDHSDPDIADAIEDAEETGWDDYVEDLDDEEAVGMCMLEDVVAITPL
ncbi:hypothetical protein VTO73DRAFT_8465 [Trametes versicolor]